MSKFLLIDGNNMAFRVHHTHQHLNRGGAGVGVLFGFLKSLIGLRKKFPDHIVIIGWDSKSKRRIAESTEAVENGLIETYYKFKGDVVDPYKNAERADIFEQMTILKDEILCYSSFNQIRMQGYEADDVLATLSKTLSDQGHEVVDVTTDKDYYQLISELVTIYNPSTKKMWDLDAFEEEFGYRDTDLWIDRGALTGDKGDNIHGVPSWGGKTADKYINLYGTVENIVKAVQEKDKRSKVEERLLENLDGLRLAKSLKRMDIIEDIPKLNFSREKDREMLKNIFLKYRFLTLAKDLWRL